MVRRRKAGAGAKPLKDQIKLLEERLGEKGLKQAEEIIKSYSYDVIRLAFRKSPKPKQLSPNQKKFYDQMAEIDVKSAEAWRNKRLVEKQELGYSSRMNYPTAKDGWGYRGFRQKTD